MRTTLRTKGFELTEGGREGIEKALKSVESLFINDIVYNVFILKREKDYKCEIKVQSGRDFIRAEETGKTFEIVVTSAVNQLKKRVRKIKSMQITKKRGNDTLPIKKINTNIYSDIDENSELIDFKIERRKSIKVDSLSEEEAVLQLESLNHSFYVFKNKDLNNSVCVIYRRSVGYGLIDIE